MTGYDKLRAAISKTVAGHVVLANLRYDDFVVILTAAGIPIEALANGEMVAVEGWQPIKTAPRNRQPFLAWIPEWHVPAVLFEDGGYLYMPIEKDGRMPPRNAKPTHWMPLPVSPKEPADEIT